MGFLRSLVESGITTHPSFNDFGSLASEDVSTQKDLAGLVDGQPAAMPPSEHGGEKPDVWRSVFDPGSNPRANMFGKHNYDHVQDKKSEPTTWDFILQGEKHRPGLKAEAGDHLMPASELRAKLSDPGTIDELVRSLEREDGQVHYPQFCERLRSFRKT